MLPFRVWGLNTTHEARGVLGTSLVCLGALGGCSHDGARPGVPSIESAPSRAIVSQSKGAASSVAAAQPPAPMASLFDSRVKPAALGTEHATCLPVHSSSLYRFVEGADSCMVEMNAGDIDAKLNDPFALNVLRKGLRPDSVEQVVAEMTKSGLVQQSFLVGEGSQVPATTDIPRSADRNLRYAVAWTNQTNAPGAFLSAAPGGASSFLQVIGWDSKNAAFNFYELRAQPGSANGKAWSWAGDTTLAGVQSSRDRGCFDCHHNGVPIMKELARPWNNWHSELATVAPLNVPEAVASEPLFAQRAGGDQLEPLIRSAFQTYYLAWLRANFQRQGTTVRLTQANEMLRHLTTNTTVNFESSQVQSRGAATSPPEAALTGVPNHLFLWDALLGTSLRLTYRVPPLCFERAAYDAYLVQHRFQLVQDDSASPFSVPGSTWFSFFAPVPSAEDQFAVLQLLNAKVFTEKFVAAVLLVDFPTPVFSAKRTSLQQYGEQISTGTLNDSTSSIVTDFVALVGAAAKQQPACTDLLTCSAEQQFLATWNLPDVSWRAEASKRIQAYLDASVENASLDDVMRLVERRRDAFADAPPFQNLNEFSLLLPRNNLDFQETISTGSNQRCPR